MDKLFRILEINETLAKDIASKEYDIHFHDFEELILITEGSLTHYIDFAEGKITAPFASYISMGKMHRITPQSDLRGWVINYKTEFISETGLNFYSNFSNFTNVSLSEGFCIDTIASLCRLIYSEYKYINNDLNTIRHLVNALLSMIISQQKNILEAAKDVKPSQITAFNAFLKILEENYKRSEGVSFYADKMNMSERNLNIICKNNFQKSVSDIIETRKLIEAKRMLLYSSRNISEIAFELGFNEKSYFTRVFHARTSMTPSQFRELSIKHIS